MKTSIIIPSKNEGRYLQQTVESVRANTTTTDYEIIVVDDSTDGSADFLQGQSVVRDGGAGAIAARNIGASKATGCLLVFMDANVQVGPGWLEGIKDASAQVPDSMLTAAFAPMEGAGGNGYGLVLDHKLIGSFGTHPPSGSLWKIMVCPGGFMVVPRPVFNALGGFDEGLKKWGMEDVDISLRCWELGYSVHVTSAVQIKHLHKPSGRADLDQWIYNSVRTATTAFDGLEYKQIRNGLASWAGEDLVSRCERELRDDSAYQSRLSQHRSARKRDGKWIIEQFGQLH